MVEVSQSADSHLTEAFLQTPNLKQLLLQHEKPINSAAGEGVLYAVLLRSHSELRMVSSSEWLTETSGLSWRRSIGGNPAVGLLGQGPRASAYM